MAQSSARKNRSQGSSSSGITRVWIRVGLKKDLNSGWASAGRVCFRSNRRFLWLDWSSTAGTSCSFDLCLFGRTDSLCHGPFVLCDVFWISLTSAIDRCSGTCFQPEEGLRWANRALVPAGSWSLSCTSRVAQRIVASSQFLLPRSFRTETTYRWPW